MKTILAMSLALVVGIASTSEGASVFPNIDGGAFDGIENALTFDITSGFVEMSGLAPVLGGDINVNYRLSGNLGGPLLDMTIEFAGKIGSQVFGGTGLVGNEINPVSAILRGAGVPEVSLTLVDSYFQAATSSTLYLGFTAETILPIPDGSISFLPVSFVATPVFSSTSDFILGSSSATGTNFDLNLTTGVVDPVNSTAVGQVNPIPEPASLLTLLGCVAGVGAMGRRRRKAAVAA